MITVLHLIRSKVSGHSIYNLTYNDTIEEAKKLIKLGLYEKVAVLETDLLYRALSITDRIRKGVIRDWSKSPGVVWCIDRPNRSSTYGDIFIGDECGTFVITKLGFYEIEIPALLK